MSSVRKVWTTVISQYSLRLRKINTNLYTISNPAGFAKVNPNLASRIYHDKRKIRKIKINSTSYKCTIHSNWFYNEQINSHLILLNIMLIIFDDCIAIITKTILIFIWLIKFRILWVIWVPNCCAINNNMCLHNNTIHRLYIAVFISYRYSIV